MDHETTAALLEFLTLQKVNWTGRHPVEVGMRARALQEISGLDTEALIALAARVTGACD